MSTQSVNTGVINGRFQPLHYGHMEYLLEAWKKCDRLIVGITNADSSGYAKSDANPHRSTNEANPFSYFERMEMIKATMLDFEIAHSEFEIVPFPINSPELISSYIPLDATIFFTIYDGWGQQKIERVNDQGFQTEVLWERRPDEKITSGIQVREKIAANETWAHLVPRTVQNYIVKHRLDKKMVEAQAK